MKNDEIEFIQFGSVASYASCLSDISCPSDVSDASYASDESCPSDASYASYVSILLTLSRSKGSGDRLRPLIKISGFSLAIRSKYKSIVGNLIRLEYRIPLLLRSYRRLAV